jgi:hypothetical protein
MEGMEGTEIEPDLHFWGWVEWACYGFNLLSFTRIAVSFSLQFWIM